MLKTLAIGLLLTSTAPINAQALDAPMDWEAQPEDPVIAKYNKQTEAFENIIVELQTSDIFAGRLTEVSFRGQSYVIDRTQEAVKTKASRPSLLGTLLNELTAKSEVRIKIKVTQREFENGKIKSEEIWEIDAGGMWEAQTGGFDDASGKAHK